MGGVLMGQRGPKPLPGNVHVLRGNPSKKPLASLLDDVVRPDVAIPKKPKGLRPEAEAEWKRISAHLAVLGLISEIDRAALMGYCIAFGEVEWANKRIAQMDAEDPSGDRARIWENAGGYKQISVLIQHRNRQLELLRQFGAEFGMSPSSRSRVTASDPQLGLPGVEPKPDEPKAGGGWSQF